MLIEAISYHLVQLEPQQRARDRVRVDRGSEEGLSEVESKLLSVVAQPRSISRSEISDNCNQNPVWKATETRQIMTK